MLSIRIWSAICAMAALCVAPAFAAEPTETLAPASVAAAPPGAADDVPGEPAQDDTAQDDAAQNDAAQNDAAQNDVAQNDAAQNDAAERGPAADGEALDDTEPDDTAPDDTAPDDTAPDDTEPDDTAPDDTALDDAELEAILNSLAADADPTEPSAAASRPPAAAALVDAIDMALILDVAAAWFDGEPAQTGAHDPSANGFNLQQLEWSIGAAVDPFLRFDANLVFGLFGVELEEAYATTTALPGSLQLRAGQFLTPMGRLNPTHPHAWSFVDQPLVNGKLLGSEGSRGLGAEVSWLTPLPWFVELTGAMTGAGGECCARSYFGANDLGVEGLDDFVYTTRLEQFWPFGDHWSVLWGISGQFGPNASGHDNRTQITGTDLYLRWRPVNDPRRRSVSLQLEGMHRARQVPDDVLLDGGGQVALVAHLSPRWSTGVRQEWVTGVDDDPLDPDWSSDRHRTSAQLTFHPSHFSRVRLQGARDDRTWDRVHWSTFLALEVLVGAHGAHEY